MDTEVIITLVAVALFLCERFLGRRDVVSFVDQLTVILSEARIEREALATEFARERGELLLRLQGVLAPPLAGAAVPQSTVVVEPEEDDEYDLVGIVRPTIVEDDETPPAEEPTA